VSFNSNNKQRKGKNLRATRVVLSRRDCCVTCMKNKVVNSLGDEDIFIKEYMPHISLTRTQVIKYWQQIGCLELLCVGECKAERERSSGIWNCIKSLKKDHM